MNKMRKLAACCAAILCCAPAWPQAPGDGLDEAELRRYAVEVIIFRYAEDVATGSELFLPDEPEPLPAEDSLEPSYPVRAAEPEPVPEEEPQALPDPEFMLLQDADFQLADAYDKLERLDAYEPLMHFAWSQLALGREQTEAIPLYRFGRPPEDLDGTLTLYLGRFLHLVVDLQLGQPEPDRLDPPASGFNGFSTMPGNPVPPTFFRIQESRLMKNGELRYFDHPKFGVLARVSRIENEETVEDGELLGYPVE